MTTPQQNTARASSPERGQGTGQLCPVLVPTPYTEWQSSDCWNETQRRIAADERMK